MKPVFAASLLALGLVTAPAAFAGPDAFHAGTVIPDYGKVANVPDALPIPEGTVFMIDFDASKPAGAGVLNRKFESAARFINMQAEAGVKPQDVHIAFVVHGKASWDLADDTTYKAKYETDKANPNAKMIAELQQHGVRFIVCGQTAAYYDLNKSNLLPGVELSLSAMTEHALLQRQGYTLNPF